MTATANITIADAAALGQVVDIVQQGKRIAWIPADRAGFDSIDGVVRHFCNEAGDGGHANWNDRDIRDLWVRVSGTFEHWILVSDLVEWLKAGRAMVVVGCPDHKEK